MHPHWNGMNIILFDTAKQRVNLLPLTYTRPIAAFRVGVFTLAEKWSTRGQRVSFLSEQYLSQKYAAHYDADNLYINGAVLYDAAFMEKVKWLQEGHALFQGGQLLAVRTSQKLPYDFDSSGFHTTEVSDVSLIENVWDIFKKNGEEIRKDFSWITTQHRSQELLDPHTVVYGSENIFIEPGAKIRASVLNAEDGPIYLGKNSEVQEGALIKGPFALCEGGVVNMGGKMRGDNTVGPYSKVGGEVSNSVIFGYSNKGHDGFIGNTVIGEWCNLGADTNTSNLKNNYAEVKLWNYEKGGFKNTGQQFCGLIMGDHSKCGINTMFNTGTVVGVSANIFGSGFPRNFIPSFSWGGASGFTTFQPKKAYEVAEKVMERRKKVFDEIEKNILDHIFEQSAPYRIWEKKEG